MSLAGKEIRMKRLIDEKGACIICALDHGMTSPEFLTPLADMRGLVRDAVRGGANVFMLGRNYARFCISEFHKDTSLAFMLTASSARHPKANLTAAIAEVEEALYFGADAVVVYVALATEQDKLMIEFVARVGKECEALGMPFIAEAEYPNIYMPVGEQKELGGDYLLYNARICAELGADIIKTNWPGSKEEFAKIVEAVRPVPVVIAGGHKISDAELLKRMEQGIKVGAVGCSIGRNIFLHRSPFAMTRALSRVIREEKKAEEALEELEQKLRPVP
jgi:fructose-bisphosphate aldolase/2-amino-3,7-dideoxy-D-threo-hept-6-ulosonate synthase